MISPVREHCHLWFLHFQCIFWHKTYRRKYLPTKEISNLTLVNLVYEIAPKYCWIITISNLLLLFVKLLFNASSNYFYGQLIHRLNAWHYALIEYLYDFWKILRLISAKVLISIVSKTISCLVISYMAICLTNGFNFCTKLIWIYIEKDANLC